MGKYSPVTQELLICTTHLMSPGWFGALPPPPQFFNAGPKYTLLILINMNFLTLTLVK